METRNAAGASAHGAPKGKEEVSEAGGDGLDGALGNGIGKWRLFVASDVATLVVNLLPSPTEHLSNLSSRLMASPAVKR